MPLNLVRIAATIKYVSVYRCATCGLRQTGNTVVDRFDGSSTTELKDYVDQQRQTAHHMPTGWSYDGEFRCPDHVR